MKTITINQLETVFGRVIDKLKFELGKDGEFKSDTSWYREIPADKWTKFDGGSNDEITGDLQDDIDELIKLANDKSRICTYVDFDRISSLLKEISQIQNPS